MITSFSPKGRALLCGTAVALWLHAGAASADALDQLHQFLGQTQSAKGRFSQKSPAQTGAPKGQTAANAQSQGSFEFQRPGRFRWTYEQPYSQLIISDGKTLSLYDRDLAQVTQRQLTGALPASPASILFGSNRLEDDFTVSADGEDHGVAWLLAKPKGRDGVFDRVRIGFQNGLPVAMQLHDTFGQLTELQFTQVQSNPVLPADHFHFVVPPGVDVLKDRSAP
jgi:outer membrane lipoprotein carrier protein